MIRAMNWAATGTGSEPNLGGLTQKLLALRSEIDTAIAELASHNAVQRAVAIDKTAGPLPAIFTDAPVSTVLEAPPHPLDELGVIGCLLGLRPDRPMR